VALPGTPSALRERTALRPSLRLYEPAPIAICLMAWATLSALAWASVAIAIQAI
jgi:hypothetical protein